MRAFVSSSSHSSSSHRRSAKPGAARAAVAVRLAVFAAVLLAFTGTAQAQAPVVDIQATCQAAAAAMVQLMGGSTSGNDRQACLNSEQRARESIHQGLGEFSTNDRALCIQTKVYLPSYVRWLTCMEMNRDVKDGTGTFGPMSRWRCPSCGRTSFTERRHQALLHCVQRCVRLRATQDSAAFGGLCASAGEMARRYAVICRVLRRQAESRGPAAIA